MSAQDLSYSQLTTATEPFVVGEFATMWRAHPSGLLFAPTFDRLRPIVIAAPAGSSELARLTDDITDEDAFHDNALRFGHSYLDAYKYFHVAAVRNVARQMQALLMPDGTLLVNKSYEEEVGRYKTRADACTPEVRAILAKLKLIEWEGAPLTFEQWHDEVLQASTRRLGAQLEERKRIALVSGGPSPEELLNAKRGIIRIVDQTFAGFDTIAHDLDPATRTLVAGARAVWDAEVQKATGLADDRRRARKAAEDKKQNPGPQG